MRSDLIIGIILSIAIHGGVAFGGQLLKEVKKQITKKEDTPAIEIQQPPPPPPDDEIVDMTNEPANAAEPSSIAPPSLMDTPGQVQVDSFTQALQPPPPPSLGKPTGVMNIPPGPPNRGTGIGKGLGDVFSLKDLDQIPTVKGVQAKPNYPFEMRRQGTTGEVVIQFVVDTNGDVRDPVILRSSMREFEEPARQAVLKWKFKPGRKGGKLVNARMQQLISFKLDDE